MFLSTRQMFKSLYMKKTKKPMRVCMQAWAKVGLQFVW